MVDERITERDDGVTTERVVEHSESEPHTTVVERRGGGAGWIIAVILVIAVIAGIYLFSEFNQTEAVEADAVSEAASQVGDAAQQAGDAADRAADSLTPEE
ncbi:MAG: hypothetical protein ABR601_10335 [Parasphingopyxis sp.]|nr:hypothetical protein [Sphingomonadales bacterium]